MKRWCTAFAAFALALAGCGDASGPALSNDCVGLPGPIDTALAAAPAPVRFPDGTSLSQCISRAGDQLPSVGAALDPVADQLSSSAARDPRAALALGYLIGAVERGAARAAGATAFQSRIEQDGALPGATAAAYAALARGLAAGRSTG